MLSIGQAARLLGVKPITVRRWTDAGILPCVRTPGGHRRVAREDVTDFVNAADGSGHSAVRKAREQALETLIEASTAVASQLEHEALLVEIAQHMTRLCRCDSCAIFSYEPEESTITVLAEYDAGGRPKGAPGVYDLDKFPATLTVLEEKRPQVINADDPRADPAERADLKRWGDKSILMLPLVFRGQSIGLLEAVDWDRARSYSRQEIRLASALAGHAAVALHNAELYQAADSVDTALRGLHARMRDVSARVLQASESADTVDPLPAIAAALRDAFAALSVIVTLDDQVEAATAAPTDDDSHSPQYSDAHVLTSSADSPRGRLTITAVMPATATEGEGDLLEMATSFAVLVSAYTDPGRHPGASRRGDG